MDAKDAGEVLSNPPADGRGAATTAGGEVAWWSWGTRVAFRFCFVYWILYILPFPFIAFTSNYRPLTAKYYSFWDALVSPVGGRVFGLHAADLAQQGSDSHWNYIQLLCYLTIAGLAAVIWTGLDRKRVAYLKMYEWLRICLRITLGYYFIYYGMEKVFPNQMPSPPLLWTLSTPYGELNPFDQLWAFIGSSPAYEMFCGWMETIAGALLIIPRTTVVGAVIAIGVMTNVLLLNLCYDVPVKLRAFHFLLMGVFLLAPDAGRLFRLGLLGEKVELRRPTRLFERRWLNKSLVVLQVAFGAYVILFNALLEFDRRKIEGNLETITPLYGIWIVEEFTEDGQVKPPLVTDGNRWRRVVFNYPGTVYLQMCNDDWTRYNAEVVLDKKALTMTKDGGMSGAFTFKPTGGDSMTLTGNWDGHAVDAKLQKFDEQKYPIMSSGFEWFSD